jgi:peptidoglycan/xylan/chitin deacetylase (PgdA/CDA1 family)
MAGERRRGCLALTFDNLGEAREIERGAWPADAPVGRHRSVTEGLPRLLAELDALGLTATFFVEAINCEIYPEAVTEIAERGHELGMHGWRHEQWAGLSAERERSVLQRSRRAFASLGVTARAFRPPAGGLNLESPGLLREAGIDWCSPEGGRFGVADGLAYLPFEWELVDAYYLMKDFAELRVRHGDGSEPLDPDAVVERISAELNTVARGGGEATVILHPFLLLDPAWWLGVRALLAALGRDARLSVGPGGALAGQLRALR